MSFDNPDAAGEAAEQSQCLLHPKSLTALRLLPLTLRKPCVHARLTTRHKLATTLQQIQKEEGWQRVRASFSLRKQVKVLQCHSSASGLAFSFNKAQRRQKRVPC